MVAVVGKAVVVSPLIVKHLFARHAVVVGLLSRWTVLPGNCGLKGKKKVFCHMKSGFK